jgi:hypothetical protein
MRAKFTTITITITIKCDKMATEVKFFSSSHGMPHHGLKKVLVDEMKLHQQRFQPFTINGKFREHSGL